MTLFELENDDVVLQTSHDFRGCDFVWYNEPVVHFDLINIDHRVVSFNQLKYYAEVFFYLNPDISYEIIRGLFRWLGDRENGRSIRTYSKARVDDMIEDVYQHPKVPYCRRMRKVVFNPEIIISVEEKLSIVAQMVSKGLTFTENDLRMAIENLSNARLIITHDALSEYLMCSTKTIHRLMTVELKNKIKLENINIKREKSIEKVIEWIDVLSDSGDGVKIQEIKNLTNVRDYSIIKEAFRRYETAF